MRCEFCYIIDSLNDSEITIMEIHKNDRILLSICTRCMKKCFKKCLEEENDDPRSTQAS